MVEKEDGDGGGDRQVFAGVSYRLLGFDCQALEGQYKTAIDRRGGKTAIRFDKASCTHLIVYSERVNYDDHFCVMARRNEIIVVNEHWVNDSVSCGGLTDPKRILYSPVRDLCGIPGSLKLHICSSGYSLERCKEIERMVHFMGASFYGKWTEKATHLICYEFDGHDYNLAKKCKANVVNHKWLEDCLKEWKIVPIDNYTIRQHFLDINFTRLAVCLFSGSELELVEPQSEGVNKKMVFNTKILRRQYRTPQSKSSSIDTTRKAFSAGTKRSNVHIDSENTVKCRRALNYGSSSSSNEISMYEYSKRELTKRIQIPYMLNKRKMAKEGIKLILLNAYGLILDLRCEGKSLKGSFTSKNFLIQIQTKKVMIRGIEPLPYSKGDGEIDKLQFIVMVSEMFGSEVPEEIKIWLCCIKDGVHDNVLRRHVNMLHSNEIFGEFWLMYHSLLKMRSLEKDKFCNLLRSLEAYDKWELVTFKWCILEDNRHYKDPNAADQSGSIQCRDNAFGLMQQIRNCWEHPAKLYPELLLAVMLGEFPNLLSDVQIELYDAGYLPQLDTKNME